MWVCPCWLLAGLVWDRVAAVSKAPVDNKACLFTALGKVMTVMKDTIREVRCKNMYRRTNQHEDEGEDEMGSPSLLYSNPIRL